MTAVLVLFAVVAAPRWASSSRPSCSFVVAARLMGLRGWWRPVALGARRHRWSARLVFVTLARRAAAVSELFVALTPANLLACFAGVVLGTIVGVLPGLGPAGAMALVLPLTIKLGPTAGLIMLAGIYYGAMYGGSTTSILVNVPGEAASVVTTIDGYRLARRGRAGAALAIAAIASFVAGTFSVIALQLAAPLGRAARAGLRARRVLRLRAAGRRAPGSNLTGGSRVKSLAMVVTGRDALDGRAWIPLGGTVRFTFDVAGAQAGLSFIAVTAGSSAWPRCWRPRRAPRAGGAPVPARALPRALPEPRGAAALGAADAPRHRARLSHRPDPRAGRDHRLLRLLRRGEARVALPARARDRARSRAWPAPRRPTTRRPAAAWSRCSSLGLPFTPSTAVLLSGMLLMNVTPGPFLLRDHPQVFWGVIGSFYVGNVMLLLLNLPLVGLFARVATIPPRYLMPARAACSARVAAYSDNNNAFDVWVMVGAGLLGYAMRGLGYEPGAARARPRAGPVPGALAAPGAHDRPRRPPRAVVLGARSARAQRGRLASGCARCIFHPQ